MQIMLAIQQRQIKIIVPTQQRLQHDHLYTQASQPNPPEREVTVDCRMHDDAADSQITIQPRAPYKLSNSVEYKLHYAFTGQFDQILLLRTEAMAGRCPFGALSSRKMGLIRPVNTGLGLCYITNDIEHMICSIMTRTLLMLQR